MTTPARYWREIPQRYRYEGVKCKKSGQIFFPPRLICPEHKSDDFEKINLETQGKIVTYTVVRVAPPQFRDLVPYAVAIVELNDGARITAMIADCEPEEVKIDMPVRIEFRKIHQEGEAGIICYGYKCVPA